MPDTQKRISVFVDESGILNEPDTSSRFYILTFVFHDQSKRFDDANRALEESLRQIGIVDFCFHCGPLIHKNDGFQFMDWDFRRKIFAKMMHFTRTIGFRYHCFYVDKRFCNSVHQMIGLLESQISAFLDAHGTLLEPFTSVKVYYDCGQKSVTNLLHRVFEKRFEPSADFAQAVLPQRYRLAQVADLICTLQLLELKLRHDIPLSLSEIKFFGGARNLRRNVLRKIKTHEIE